MCQTVPETQSATLLYNQTMKLIDEFEEQVKSMVNDIRENSHNCSYLSFYNAVLKHELDGITNVNQAFEKNNIIIKQQSVTRTTAQNYSLQTEVSSANTSTYKPTEKYNISSNEGSKADSDNAPPKNFVVDILSPKFKKENVHLNTAFYSDNSISTGLTINTSGDILAFFNNQRLFLFGLGDGSKSEVPIPVGQTQPTHYQRVKFSNDGKYIAVTYHIEDIGIYSIEVKKFVHTLKQTSALCLQFTSDSKYLISSGHDCSLCIWDFSYFTLHKKIDISDTDNKSDEKICSICLDSGDKFIFASFSSGIVKVFNLSLEFLYEFKAHNSKYTFDICASPVSNEIYITCDSSIKSFVFDNKKAEHRYTFSGHTNLCTTLCLSPFNNILISGSKDETLRAWDTTTSECLFVLKAHDNTILTVCHHAKKNMFFSCGGDGIICVWEYSI